MRHKRKNSAPTGHAFVSPVSRRTLVAGAGWSIPAVAVASSMPAFASSIEDCTDWVEVQKDILAPSANNLTQGFQRATEPFIVPDDVTEITFDIAGGGGGVNRNHTNNTVSHPGGDGDRIQGTLKVVPGTTLTLIAGNGGIGPTQVGSATPSNTSIKGGEGYGNGGDLPTGTAKNRYAGGSGGGGSAILIDDQPILVAGGGGGSGGGTPGGYWTWTLDAGGGHGGLTATAGTQARGYGSGSPTYSVDGGAGANGATPGTRANAGGQSGWIGDGANGSGRTYGNNGLTPAEGGHGGTGRQSYANNGFIYTAGAGGGGYAGGASADAYTVAYYYGSTSTQGFAAALGGGGGGGSSFVSEDLPAGFEILSASHERAGNGAHPALQRNPGWVKISYWVC